MPKKKQTEEPEVVEEHTAAIAIGENVVVEIAPKSDAPKDVAAADAAIAALQEVAEGQIVPDKFSMYGRVSELKDHQRAKLHHDFTYHAPHGNQPERYNALRADAKLMAASILINTPESREQTIALNHLKTAIMWANAAIAVNEAEG